MPNNLEVNAGGDKFHLASLTSVTCSLIGGVPTITGTGTGTFNGAPATISFTFTDAGEPGSNDFARIVVTSGGATVLSASGSLDRGNQQFHSAS